MKKNVVIVLSVVIALAIVLYINYMYIVLIHTEYEMNKNYRMGIIDGNITLEHKNVFNDVLIDEGSMQHGDYVLSFLYEYNPNIKFAYYDAECEGKISSDTIIEGLEWMMDNDVEYVCISLSSTYYSEELDNWINLHKGDIKIYASYSNLFNTMDYPAQYENVIGVGSDNRIKYKENDVECRTNKILLLGKGIKIYSGNSYLAPIQMIRNVEGKM